MNETFIIIDQNMTRRIIEASKVQHNWKRVFKSTLYSLYNEVVIILFSDVCENEQLSQTTLIKKNILHTKICPVFLSKII